MPHGGVLQNQWMKVLERLCSGTSGWPRIRCSMQPLPSLPCPLSGLSLSSSAETSRLLSIWDTAVHPTHQRLTYIGSYQVVVVAIFDELLRARLNIAKTRVIRLRGIFCSAFTTRRLKPCNYVYGCIELGVHCDDTSVKLLNDPTRLN